MGIGAGKASAFRRMALVVALTAATAWLAFRATRIATPADPLASLYQRGHPFTATVAALDEVAPVPRLLIAIV